MDKNSKLPAVCWLKVTDYMHGWLQWELGGTLRIKDQKVLSVQHLPGARDVMRMEISDSKEKPTPADLSISATWRNCIDAGLELDPSPIKEMYGISAENLKLFVPVECPKMCLTINGVMRPWTLEINFSHRQATALQRLLRDAFWNAVAEYNEEYARKVDRKFPAVEMIEAFCSDTRTPDLYVETIRREWQRRVKRKPAQQNPG